MPTPIEDSFENRKNTYIFGLAVWSYWIYHLAASRQAFKILPPVRPVWIAGLFGVVFLAQIFSWVYFKHFHGKWYLKIQSYLFFLLELGILAFTLSFVLWPVFLAFKSKLI